MAGCTKCDLGKYREETGGKIVWRDGNLDAKIMLLGEAPGAAEEASGKPFVGRAGKKLRAILSKFIDLEKDIFISNTTLCRPPDNRKPTLEEQAICFPHIEAMFFLIKPKLVITAGRISSDWLSQILHKEYEIYKMQEVRWNDLWFLWLPMYHPSYLLRKPTTELLFIACLQRYKGILNRLCKNANQISL